MMIGKIKISEYKYLLFFISILVLFISYYTHNFYINLLFFSSLFFSEFFTKYGLNIIKKFNILQKIKKESPLTHHGKENTPTMGGIFFIPIFLIILLLTNFPNDFLKPTLFLTIIGFFLIGLIDDFLSIKNNINLGLKGKEKIFLQIIITFLFLLNCTQNGIITSNIQLSSNILFDLQAWIIPLSFITIIALSNAVNLTDGLDGLASGCSSIVFFGLGTEILLNNNNDEMIYSLLSFSMSGICLGFLKFNKFPAKIFMGDTGSLSIGAIIGLLCVLTNSFLTTFIISGIFFIETLSVMVQVSYFKITKKIFNKGKRVFLMSPLHHHLEMKGLKEKTIVINFWKINILLVIFCIVLKISFLK